MSSLVFVVVGARVVVVVVVGAGIFVSNLDREVFTIS